MKYLVRSRSGASPVVTEVEADRYYANGSGLVLFEVREATMPRVVHVVSVYTLIDIRAAS